MKLFRKIVFVNFYFCMRDFCPYPCLPLCQLVFSFTWCSSQRIWHHSLNSLETSILVSKFLTLAYSITFCWSFSWFHSLRFPVELGKCFLRIMGLPCAPRCSIWLRRSLQCKWRRWRSRSWGRRRSGEWDKWPCWGLQSRVEVFLAVLAGALQRVVPRCGALC